MNMENISITEDLSVSQDLSSILDIVKYYYELHLETKNKLEGNTADSEDKGIEGDIQDVLHKLEFDTSLAYHEYAKLGKILAELRVIRRECKNILDLTFPIYSFYKEPSNVKVLNKLTKIRDDIVSKEIRIDNYKYSPRGELGSLLFAQDGLDQLKENKKDGENI